MLFIADPVPVHIFVGMLLLGDAIQLNVFSAQVRVNGLVSQVL
jgi:hypothetical protein